MQRPVMNPIFMDGAPTPPRRRRPLIDAIRSAVRAVSQFLLTDLRFWRRGPALKIEDGAAWARALHAAIYRLLFAPIVIVGVVTLFVYAGTRTRPVVNSADPMSTGLYFEPVVLKSADGTTHDAWLVPLVDAKRLVEEKNAALLQRQPAIVMINDHSGDAAQMLPLIHSFHESGYIVLALGAPGRAEGRNMATFGLLEWQEVAAGVELLRRRTGVDPTRVAVLGVGSGANAAVLAAVHDATIPIVVLDHPIENTDALVREYLCPPQPWLAWLSPVCKWSFELVCKVNADDIDLGRALSDLGHRPVLVLNTPSALSGCLHGNSIPQVQQFLARRIMPPGNTGTAAVDAAPVDPAK